MVLCGALMVGVPATAAVIEHDAAGAPGTGTGSPLRSAGELTDALPAGTVATASTIAGTAFAGPAPASAVPFITTTAQPGSAAAAAIAFALNQRGLPYVWGGDGPAAGDAGFDCSGLTKASYRAAGIELPRTAHTQYYAGPHVPDGAPLEPGDLVFYGVPQRVHHVGLYLGGGRMVNAPDFGKPVQIAYVRYPGDDYVGATRPAAGKDAAGLIQTDKLPVAVPPVPSPAVPKTPTVFPAPVAPDPVPGAVLGPATPQALKQNPTLPATEGTPDPQAGTTPVTTPPGTGTTSGPATSAPLTTPPTSAPPVTFEPSTSVPPTSDPPTSVTAPPVTTPTTPDPAPPTTPPVTTTPPLSTPTSAPATPPPAAVAPTALLLPAGTLPLTAARPGPDGLLPVPAAATTGTRVWHLGTAGAGTAAVRLAAGYDAARLVVGTAVTATGRGGATYALTVTSRSMMTAAQAQAAAAALTKTYRVVLLQTDPATGRILVIVAS
jgi:cell wall-associated NlpC family hydrolase